MTSLVNKNHFLQIWFEEIFMVKKSPKVIKVT